MTKINKIHAIACGILVKIILGIHVLIPASLYLVSPFCGYTSLVIILLISAIQVLVLFKTDLTRELHSMVYTSLFIWIYLATILVIHGYPMFIVVPYIIVVICDIISALDIKSLLGLIDLGD